MSGTDKKTMNLSDVQSEYLGCPNPYRNPPACKYDHRALVEYAKKWGSLSTICLLKKKRILL